MTAPGWPPMHTPDDHDPTDHSGDVVAGRSPMCFWCGKRQPWLVEVGVPPSRVFTDPAGVTWRTAHLCPSCAEDARRMTEEERGARCCGEHPPGVAGKPLILACQLCPASPTHWRPR